MQQRIWMSYTGEERLTIWLKRIHLMNELRQQRLRDLHPELDEAGVRRAWLEETYPGEFSEERLDSFEVACRERLERVDSPSQ